MTTNTMAFAISTPTSSLLQSSSSSTSGKKPSSLCSFSNPAISIPKTALLQHVKGVSQLGFGQFSQWNGLKHTGISISHKSVKMEKKGKCKGKGVYASLFGVGAPEVLVIGVVALLVFGPKGLAEVARNLGKTLRTFQPTIRELQEVSREFKSTIEREIGLDDVNYPVRKRPTPTPEDDITKDSATYIESDDSPSKSGENSWDDSLKMTEAQLRGALTQLRKEQQEEKEKEKENESVSQTPSQDIPQVLDAPQETSTVAIPSQSPESNALKKDADLTVPPGPAPKPESDT